MIALTKDWDDETSVHEVSSVVPLSVRNKAQQIIVAREEREKSPRNPAVDAHYAKKAHSARELAAAEAFLADKSSQFSRIVPARPVVETRRRRRK